MAYQVSYVLDAHLYGDWGILTKKIYLYFVLYTRKILLYTSKEGAINIEV